MRRPGPLPEEEPGRRTGGSAEPGSQARPVRSCEDHRPGPTRTPSPSSEQSP
ncbi:hypothetical protein SFR_2318 [Streptomyces sp. FR-008]|nr:hypothetical protein SFR_2318 [Streptomyces sp. FR-008]